MTTYDAGLRDLLAAHPLAAHWGTPTAYVETILVNGIGIHLVGLCCESAEGEAVTGSAAELTQPPLRRAYFELLERTSVLDALRDCRPRYRVFDAARQCVTFVGHDELFPRSPDPTQWRHARSNGVALSIDWQGACTSARHELIERDRVLRCWYGQTRAFALALPDPLVPAPLRDLYEFRAYSFPSPDPVGSGAELAHVAGLFGFPKALDAPLIFGFAARRYLDRALLAATRECLQRLGFLWGEVIPSTEPRFTPTPEFHQEYYLQPSKHDVLRAWLEGCQPLALSAMIGSHTVRAVGGFVDLTPAELSGNLFVAKAIPESELPLAFGRGHPWLGTSISPALGVHPIA